MNFEGDSGNGGEEGGDNEEDNEGSENPSLDTDNDGLSDEFEVKLFPICKLDNSDTNGNGISDYDEDSDGDGVDDGKEHNSLFLDPLSPDKYITTGEYIGALCKGFILGDAIENPDTVNIVGAIIGNVCPVIGTVADLRDLLVNFFKEDYIMAGANLAGILPALGDSAQLLSKLSKYLENLKYSDEVIDAVNTVIKLGDKVVPSKVQLMLIEKLLVAGSYADFIIDFFNIKNTYNNSDALKEAAKIVEKILGEVGKSNITLAKFIDALKILSEKGGMSAYPNMGQLLKEAAESSKSGDEFAKQFLEEVAIKQNHLTAISNIPTGGEVPSIVKKSLVGISNRIKGYIGEFTLYKKLSTHNYTVLNKNKNKVNTTGADLVALVKNQNGKDILYIAEAKAWRSNVGAKELRKYFDKDILNLDYTLEGLSEIDRNNILDRIYKGDLEVKFELWLCRPAGAKNEGLTKDLKNSIFGGENGKLSNGSKITDEWSNNGKGIYEFNDVKMEVDIKSGYSQINN